MDEVYVRKDVFEETLRRIEAKMDASESRMSREVDKVLHQYQRDTEFLLDNLQSMKDSHTNMEKRIDDMHRIVSRRDSVITWVFSIMGFVVTLSAIIIAGVQVYMSLGVK